MRWSLLAGALVLAATVLLLSGAEGETYTNLTVESSEALVWTEDVTVHGDLMVNGTLTLEGMTLVMNTSKDKSTPEIRVNPGGHLILGNATVTNLSSLGYDLVVDQGQLEIRGSNLNRTMLWLVMANATVVDSVLDGDGWRNFGIFAENTTLTASNVTLRNYSLGVRAIGVAPDLSDMIYENCALAFSQEWWVTLRIREQASGRFLVHNDLAVVADEVTTMGPSLLYEETTWSFWAREYSLDATGARQDHTTSLEIRYHGFIGDWGHYYTTWEQRVTANTDVVHEIDQDDAARLEFSDFQMKSWAQKWERVEITYTLSNPTDVNFSLVRVHLLVNNETDFFYLQDLALPPQSSATGIIIWPVSQEGLITVSLMLDDGITPGAEAKIDHSLKVSTSPEPEGKSSGTWLAVGVLLLLTATGAYIIYNNLDQEPPGAAIAKRFEEHEATEPEGADDTEEAPETTPEDGNGGESETEESQDPADETPEGSPETAEDEGDSLVDGHDHDPAATGDGDPVTTDESDGTRDGA